MNSILRKFFIISYLTFLISLTISIFSPLKINIRFLGLYKGILIALNDIMRNNEMWRRFKETLTRIYNEALKRMSSVQKIQ
ncbi:hypothetical protein [Sulfurisphaera ohwakuensis]|uniref:Uncharacterized protein n=1 Tax=Sulfurisphaera ohwakuensis TaxID=69656 RepID=A0A650CFQ1_SULOH|nr:hypothetical protein [Sulfurisphaera ohwakuensis]MBB5254925.1 hypothetical protein [Sulfurisphaera ohwakuensis]QGR16599.1 hypothetical protein D1869_04875 [Sulfurisphaera ohwakuensis]